MNFEIGKAKCKIIAHKYLVMIEHPEIERPFKMVVRESIVEEEGESLGWIAMPEIQLRQTVECKQEYIMSNANPTPDQAVQECLFKMMLTDAKEIFYPDFFEGQCNKLW